MKELAKIYKELGQDFINDLFKDYLVVSEKLSGSAFSFERSGTGLKFFKSNEKPINLIDRTLMVYYEAPINYIKKTTQSFIDSMPVNWRFCFQYFVHNEPGLIRYDNMPKNNLVLTHIQVKNQNGKLIKLIEDPRIIEDWGNALGVTPLLPIFKGYLTDDQKEKIKTFIATPIEDQLEIFKTSSFAEYLITVLNPKLTSTILQDDLTKPIESIIFKFYKPGTTQSMSAKMIDPYTANLLKYKDPIDPKKVPADINEILILDILAFIEERGLRGGEILSSSPDERYLELVSSIFNEYVTRRGKGLKDLGIEKADFAKGDEFKLNIDLIPSKATQDILKKDEKMQDLFKIMLGSLRKKRNPEKAGNILTPSVIEDFNKMVSKIDEVINKPVDDKFKTFSDYLDLKKTNESFETAEDLLIEEKILRYNNFINLGKLMIKESTLPKYKVEKFWSSSYEKYAKSKDWVNPSSRKGNTGEVLRANFGANDGTAETSIQNFLSQMGGIDGSSYYIESLPVGVTSGDYAAYKIIFTKPATDELGQTYKKGDFFTITNKYKVSKTTGEAGIIGKKALTPNAMGLVLSEYKSPADLFSKVQSYVDSTNYPDHYKNFILETTREVMVDSRNGGSYANFESYAKSSNTNVVYDVTDSLFEDIDQISISNFANDYGEVLGGFMLFNVLKDYGAGLRYPTASNEKLVDFYFDNYSISSKAGKGGTPSGDTIIQRIFSHYKEGHLTFDTTQESDFLNNVILQWVNPPKLSRSNTYNNVINLCNINITDHSNSGFWYLVSKVNVQPSSLTQDAIISYCDNLYKTDKEEFLNMLRTLWTKSDISWNESKIKEYGEGFLNLNEKIGPIFYPLMVEITKNLNSKYKAQLTKYAQMVTDVKQIYLDVNIKRGIFSFRTVPFTTAKFVFEQKGSIPNPFNANIGIRIEK